MHDKLHNQLVADTQALEKILSECSTETIVGRCCAIFLTMPDAEQDLSAPYKQLFFLLGLMLNSGEPVKPIEFEDSGYQKAVTLLERIFSIYGWMYFSRYKPEAEGGVDDRDRVEVAMPAFLHYFSSGLMASTDQIRKRIIRYLVPFDEQLHEIVGIGVKTMLAIVDSITKQLQECIDTQRKLIVEEKEARLSLLDRAKEGGWNMDRTRKEAMGSEYQEKFLSMLQSLERMCKLDQAALNRDYGSTIMNIFLKTFSVRRGQTERLQYLTEANPAESSPLFWLPAGDIMVPSAHALYMAVLSYCEGRLSVGEHRLEYFRRRDAILEEETKNALTALFPSGTTVLSNVYETEKRQFEHDIVVLFDDTVLVIEAKASPPVEPFRDPEKAYLRIKRAFGSDRGIQKAYDQAMRIYRPWSKGEEVRLFDENGSDVASIDNTRFKRMYCVCVTRDNFGPLATNLSLLLEKDQKEPYPWVANILDLQTMVDAWDYFGWDAIRLLEYLEDRQRLHGRVFSGDEMEFVGFMISHGSLEDLLAAKSDLLILDPAYAQVFDKIYLDRLKDEQQR